MLGTTSPWTNGCWAWFASKTILNCIGFWVIARLKCRPLDSPLQCSICISHPLYCYKASHGCNLAQLHSYHKAMLCKLFMIVRRHGIAKKHQGQHGKVQQILKWQYNWSGWSEDLTQLALLSGTCSSFAESILQLYTSSRGTCCTCTLCLACS